MEEMIKLIWDFRGNDSKMTAIHHARHLKTYALENGLDQDQIKVKNLNDLHSIAFMIVARSQMINVRDSLRPHRGEVA